MKRTKSNPRGAGRPKLGKVRLMAKVKPETRLKIERLAGVRTAFGTPSKLLAVSKLPRKTIGEVLDEHFFEKQ